MTTNLERCESRSDRGETADSRREPAQIGAAVKDCPAYASAVLACSLLFSLYAFPLPATPKPFQLFGPRFPPGHLLVARAGGRTFTPPWAFSPARSPVFRRPPEVRRSRANYFAASWWCGAGLGPTPPRAHTAAHVQRRFSPTGPYHQVYLHTHSPGLVILSGLSGQYSRPGSPAGRAPRGKENLQRSNMGAAFGVRHSDTSSCGWTGMQQASSLALAACNIERVQRHVPAYRLVCTKLD